MTNTDWLRPGRDYTDEQGIQRHETGRNGGIVRMFEMLLAEVPDAYIIVNRASSAGGLDGGQQG